MASLLFLKWREGRMPGFTRKSKAVSRQQPSSENLEHPETPLEESEKDVKNLPAGPQLNKTE
jgi:hypothetical protein